MMKNAATLMSLMTVAILGTSAAWADHHETEVKAWDQKQVSEVATAFADSMGGIRDSQRAAPKANRAAGSARAEHRFTDDLRLIQSEAKHLAKRVGEGANREETQPVYDRLSSLLKSAREDARRMMLVAQVTEKIDASRVHMNALREYYGDPPVGATNR